MRVQAFDGFWQIGLVARHFLVNVYLVEGDDSLTLVDTGYGLAAAGIFDQAKRLGKPINRIALTHGHRDHAGGVDKMKAARPGLELVCSERD